MKVVFLPEFVSRLDDLEHYVANELSSPDAASKLVDEIVDGCAVLEMFPYLGRTVVSENRPESEYRWILVRHYIVLYGISDGFVLISNLVDARSDELSRIVKR